MQYQSQLKLRSAILFHLIRYRLLVIKLTNT